MRAGRADGVAHASAFVRAEIVHHDNVAPLERREQKLLHVCKERLAIDRPVQQTGRGHLVVAQGREEGLCCPASVGNMIFESHATQTPSSERRHVRLGPGFVNENKPPRINCRLTLAPPPAPARDVETVLLAGDQGFFCGSVFHAGAGSRPRRG